MKQSSRIKRRISIRKKIFGTAKRPRLAVFRSSQHIYAQLIDDSKGVTLVLASDLKIKRGSKLQKALKVGRMLAEVASKLKIDAVIFDRGGFLYHGRIKALAEGAREKGLKF